MSAPSSTVTTGHGEPGCTLADIESAGKVAIHVSRSPTSTQTARSSDNATRPSEPSTTLLTGCPSSSAISSGIHQCAVRSSAAASASLSPLCGAAAAASTTSSVGSAGSCADSVSCQWASPSSSVPASGGAEGGG